MNTEEVEIPQPTMGQRIAVVAEMVTAYIGSMHSADDEDDVEKSRQVQTSAVALLIYCIVDCSHHPENMANILEPAAKAMREKATEKGAAH